MSCTSEDIVDGRADFVMIKCLSNNNVELDERITRISTVNIGAWDTSTIISRAIIEIEARRDELSRHSSYFRALLTGSFSESSLKSVVVRWNLSTFISVLKCIYDCESDVNFENWRLLLEAALYFGVEKLISQVRSWFLESFPVMRSTALKISLEDLIELWNFGVAHATDFVSERCADYLAINFEWAASCKSFGFIPYDLLIHCLKLPYLTIDSEVHVVESLLSWITFNEEYQNATAINEKNVSELLKQIRIHVLPLWFVAGQKSSHCFRALSTKSIRSILRMGRMCTSDMIDFAGDNLHDIKIRLTQYTTKVDISGCPQMTEGLMIFSLLSSSLDINKFRGRLKELLFELERSPGIHREILQLPSFISVREIDISKCQRFNLKVMNECFATCFPSLRKLKAAYCLAFKTVSLHKLVQRLPYLSELDLKVDSFPVMYSEKSVMSYSDPKAREFNCSKTIYNSTYFARKSSFSHVYGLTKLILEGRCDVSDYHFQSLSGTCSSLCYLNIRGCASVSDIGIAHLIRACKQLHSILACDTCFGMNSALALRSNFSSFNEAPFENRSATCKLKSFHIGGCKNISEYLLRNLLSEAPDVESLCLRGTNLSDDVLYSFPGSSLQSLDVSLTMISRAALAHVVERNSFLKSLNLRDCKNLVLSENIPAVRGQELVHGSRHPYINSRGKCILHEIFIGWGFSFISLNALTSTIHDLRNLSVFLGGSVDESSLQQLPVTCPLLQSLTLYFQAVPDDFFHRTVTSFRNLQSLSLCYCFTDICISYLKLPMPNLKKLKLERVTPSMTNDDLNALTQYCNNLVELRLLGCRLTNPDSLNIISEGWPGLLTISLEECGDATTNGVFSLLKCVALEDITLRHNGCGIPSSFVLDAASKFPMLRKLSLDACDALEGDFELPTDSKRFSFSNVRIARCDSHKVHKETVLLMSNSSYTFRNVVKDRL